MYEPSLERRPNLAFQKPTIDKRQFLKYIKLERKPIDYYNNKEMVIVIVAYNERELLIKLVEKLLAIKDGRAGIMIVDNGLDKDIKKLINRYPLYYIETTSNIGCTGGRNLAAAYVKTPLIAFLDADGDIESNYIEEAIRSMSNTSTIASRGKVLPLTKNSRTPPHYDLGDNVFPYYTGTEGISVWRTKDYKKAGGFEIDLYGGEGVVLNYRMISSMGYSKEQFIYYPGLVLYHDYNNDIAHLASKEIRNLTNRWNIDLKYPLLSSLLVEFNSVSAELRKAHQDKNSIKIKKLIQENRTKFNDSLERLYNNNLENRWKKTNKSKKGEKFKFAVIIPCYNLGHMVENAVKSIMKQTIDSVQIIVVDDASPDYDNTTIPILKSLESRVQVIYRKKNGGASAARNTGIKAANADYILCLDSDDTIEPTYLEEAYNLFQMDQSIGVVSSWVKLSGIRDGSWKPKDNIEITDALLSSPIPNASCFKKHIWEEVGGYDENMRGYEDWEFWISILEKGGLIKVIPRFHYGYLTRPESKVKTSNRNAANIVSYIISKHENIFNNNMNFVISTLYKKYVDSRAKVAQITSDYDEFESDFITRNIKRIKGKTKTVIKIAFLEKNPKELLYRLKKKTVKYLRKPGR